MRELGLGKTVYSLRRKIQEIQSEINALDKPMQDMPELISSANLLRSNEYLSKSNEKKSELILAYTQYAKSLEDLLSIVFEIQTDLKNILKEQSAMISSQKTPPIRKSTRKPKKPSKK